MSSFRCGTILLFADAYRETQMDRTLNIVTSPRSVCFVQFSFIVVEDNEEDREQEFFFRTQKEYRG